MHVEERDYTMSRFEFACGRVLDKLRQHYRVFGTPRRGEDGTIRNAVLLLHGSAGEGSQFLQSQTADHLFNRGQPLDTESFFVLLPDAIGHGRSSKPSDGMRSAFPQYSYGDIVSAQYRLVTEHLGITRLRLVAGTSMGGMQTWMWGQRYPDLMDALMPIASLPHSITGRNLLWRRALIAAIRDDPSYDGGHYVRQPAGLATAWSILRLMTSGMTALEQEIQDVEQADDALRDLRANAISGEDANDVIYEFEASEDYDPYDALARIKVPLLAVNFADDEVNPRSAAVFASAAERLGTAHNVVVPLGPRSDGHRTLMRADTWAPYLRQILDCTR